MHWRALLPILLATSIVAGLCLFGDPLFNSNDDSFLAMVGSGFGVATKPEAHLVWSHYGYGLILRALTPLIGLNAHGWATLATIWLSLVLTIGAALRAPRRRIFVIVLLVLVGCVYLAVVLSPEFTITAAISFGAGIAIWLIAMGSKKPHSYIWSVTAVAALILSELIRPDSYLMGMVIVAPPLLLLCWRRSELRVPTRFLALALVIIASVGYVTDKAAYLLSPDWRDVPEYSELARNFTDYEQMRWLPKAPEYEHAGWSYDDFMMFTYWYTRHRIFSFTNVSFLVKQLAKPLIPEAPARIWAWFSFAFASWPLIFSLSAQGTICLILSEKRKLAGGLFICGEFAAIAMAASTGRPLLDYVWYAAADATLLSLCGLWISDAAARKSWLGSWGLVLAGLIGISSGLFAWFDHQGVSSEAKDYRHWLLQNSNLLQGKVTVWDVGLKWEWLITPTRIYPPFPQLKVASIDDINEMPVETAMLAELGIDDLAKELCTDPEMRLFCPPQLIPVLTGFCERHYGIKPVFKQVASCKYHAICVLANPQSPRVAPE